MTSPFHKSATARLTLAVSLAAMMALTAPPPAWAATEANVPLVQDGRALLQKGDVKAALIQFKKAVKENPSSAEARFELADLELRTGDHPSAERDFLQALELGFPAEKVIPKLGWTYLLQAKFDKLMKGLPDCPDDQDCKSEILSLRARAFLAQRDLKNADAESQASLRIKADSLMGLHARALVLAAEGDFAQAEGVIDTIIARFPKQAESLMLKGDLRRQVGDYATAVDFYRRCLALQPDNLQARTQLAITQMSLNQFDEARKEVDQALARAPKSPRALYLKALYLSRTNKNNEALDILRPIESQLIKDPSGLFLLGFVHFNNNNFEEALQFTSRFLALRPNDITGVKLLANINYHLGKFDRTVALLAPMRPQISEDPDTLELLGAAYLANGNVKEANEVLTQAVTLRPDSDRARGRLAMAKINQNETREAGIHELEGLVSKSPKNTQYGVALVASLMGNRQYDRALTEANAFIKREPDSAVPLTLRGTVHLAQGNMAAAREDFTKALGKDPNHAPALLNIVDLDMNAGDFKHARATLDSYLLTQPSDLRGLTARGRVEMRNNNPAAAIPYLERAITSHPEELEPRAMLLDALAASGDTEKAILVAIDMTRSMGNNPGAIDLAAQALFNLGRPEDTITALRRLQADFSDNPQVHQRLGQVYFRLGRLPEAATALDRALSANNTDVKVWSDRITVELKLRGVDSALALVETAQKANPNNDGARLLTGDVLIRGDRLPDAIAAYAKVQEEFPSVLAMNRLFQSLLYDNRRGEARKLMAKWLAAHPDDYSNALTLGNDLFNAGEYKAASEQFEKLVPKLPRNAVLVNNLANAYDRLDDPRAIETAKTAVTLAPQSAEIIDTYGYLLFRKGDRNQGRDLIDRAYRGEPGNPSIAFHYAQVLQDRNDITMAKSILKGILDSKAQFDEVEAVRRLYARLEGLSH